MFQDFKAYLNRPKEDESERNSQHMQAKSKAKKQIRKAKRKEELRAAARGDEECGTLLKES